MNTFSFLGVAIFLGLLISVNSSAQQAGHSPSDACRGPWQVSVKFGTQMSGIKDEDFVASNYSPLLNVAAGKWFSPAVALQAGFKGWYFHTISDEKKHKYGYYYGEIILNMNSFFRQYKPSGLWSLYIHGGSGYFYNYYYDRPNVCADGGITSNLRISRSFQASLDVSAIVGWDIYQGDEDILPGITLGLSYLFND